MHGARKGGADTRMWSVLDASVGAAWLLSDEQSYNTGAVLEAVEIYGALAPSLLRYELRNILIMATRRGRLPDGEAVRALGRVRRLTVETADMTLPGDSGIVELAERHRLTAYDAAYLQLAVERAVPLTTADGALAQAATSEGVELLERSVGGQGGITIKVPHRQSNMLQPSRSVASSAKQECPLGI